MSSRSGPHRASEGMLFKAAPSKAATISQPPAPFRSSAPRASSNLAIVGSSNNNIFLSECSHNDIIATDFPHAFNTNLQLDSANQQHLLPPLSQPYNPPLLYRAARPHPLRPQTHHGHSNGQAPRRQDDHSNRGFFWNWTKYSHGVCADITKEPQIGPDGAEGG